jgi:hypothetical protein
MAESRKRKDRRKAVSLPQRGAEEVLSDLFWELAFAHFRLNAAGSKIASKARLSPGKISVPRSLRDAGSRALPSLPAAGRSHAKVSRQWPISRRCLVDAPAGHF